MFYLLLLFVLFLAVGSSPLLRLGFIALNLDTRGVFSGDLNRTMCLGPLGCFSTGRPFFDDHRRPVSLLPFDRVGLDVRFYLYTRHNPTTGEELRAEDSRSIARSSFKGSEDTKIVIHGLLDRISYGGWLEDIKRGYLYRGNSNVILVDWARANQFPYEQAVANARAVGAEIALLIKKLMEATGSNSEKFSLVGHSLGAHVAGYAGKRIPGISRITGLDPAGPYFTGTDPAVRLDPSDAKFVDVIHTDASTSVLSGLGTVGNMGHVDFYPNGGNDQPGCNPVSNIPSLLYKGLARSISNVIGLCDHMRATELFTRSISEESCSPVAISCSTWENYNQGRCGDCNTTECLPLGEDSEKYFSSSMTHKRFYLRTSDTDPFCLFQYQVSVILDKENNTGSPVGQVYVVIQGDQNVIHAKLSSGPETLRPGSYSTYMLSSKKDVGNFDRALFYWKEDSYWSDSTANNVKRPRIYLKQMRISPLQLNSRNRSRSLKQRILCSDPKLPVFSDTDVQLSSKEIC